MKFISLLSLFISFGCSHSEFKGTDLKMNVVSYMDPTNKTLVYDYEYKNGILVYKKLVEEGRINSISKWSCFGNTKSVNYIEVTESEVKYLRSLHVDTKKTISYVKEDVNVDSKYIRKYREISSDTLKVESKKCIMKGDGFSYYIISEIYN